MTDILLASSVTIRTLLFLEPRVSQSKDAAQLVSDLFLDE
jgi:hypothetical protein